MYHECVPILFIIYRLGFSWQSQDNLWEFMDVIYEQAAAQIKDAILDSRPKPNERLPSEQIRGGGTAKSGGNL